VVRARPGNSCPYIDLSGPAVDPDALLSASLRSDLRRAQRKAEAHGKLAFEIHAPRTAAAFLPLFEEAVRVEGAGWKGRDGSALAMDERARTFFRRYGILASEEGALRLALLRIDGVPAAMQYAVQWNGGLWLLKVGYDERFSKCSPGLLLMQHTLRDAVAQGLRSYEFLGSAEPWTQRWTNAEASTTRLVVYPFGPAGLLSLSRDAFRGARKKLAAALAARGKGFAPPERHSTVPSPQRA
jgi:CelD/BcsL family acetyltransferase involved in cellulose biosynthesis